MTNKQIIDEAVKRLIAEKRHTGYFNVSIKYQCNSWSMALTAHDGKPFHKKKVNINIHAAGGRHGSKTVRILTPKEAGYTLKEFNEYA